MANFQGYVYLWWLNDTSYCKLGKVGTPRDYSLSGRFQLIENLRVFWVIPSNIRKSRIDF